MDPAPVETVGSSVTSYEGDDPKQTGAIVTEELEGKLEQVVQPPHTSPDVSFGSEVIEIIADPQ